MKRRNIPSRLLWLALAAALIASLIPAALAVGPTPRVSSNIYRQNHDTWSYPVRSYLCENPLGGLTRVEYTGSEVLVEDYDQAFVLRASRTLPAELAFWGGFFAGEEYNYLIFGQSNHEEDDEKEVIRIVQYSRDWVRLGQASLRGANTTIPFGAGSLRCDEYGGWLYVRTCHDMYASKNDGKKHQANLMIALRQSDMTITDSLIEGDVGYVSHSLDQFILVDAQGRIVTLDHGDAAPRGALLQRYVVKAGQDSFHLSEEDRWIWTDMGGGHRVGKPAPGCEKATLVTFPGTLGASTTGCSIGGLAETARGYVAAYSYDGVGSRASRRDIYLAVIGEDLSVETVRLTNGADALTPQLAAVSREKGYVLWNERAGRIFEDVLNYSNMDGALHYAAYGPDGTVGQTQTAAGVSLSDCAPVSWNGKAVWYVTDDSAPVFYLLDENGVQVKLADSTQTFTDVDAGEYYAAPVAWAVNRGITTGTGEDTFSPNNTCSHGEIVTFLWRAAGKPAATANAPVQVESWFADAVNWAYSEGMIDASFQSTASCTRADTAVYLWAASGSPQAAASPSFTDVPADAPYAAAVAWAVEKGITKGTSPTTFRPADVCTRGQIVTFLYRCFAQ